MLAYLNLIAKNKKQQLPTLDLSKTNPEFIESLLESCDLDSIPPSALALEHITVLNLVGQNIEYLPKDLAQYFPKLQRLCLHGLPLRGIPDIYGLDLDWGTYQQFKTSLNKSNIVGIKFQAKQNYEEDAATTLDNAKEVLQHIIEEFPNLLYLDLSNPGFRVDRLPPEIGKLVQIKELKLANNALRVLHKNLEQLKALEVLDLSNNRFSELPKELLKLPNLKQLNLSDNFIQHPDEKFDQLTAIEVLDLSRNGILSLPKSLSNLSRLESLLLQDFRFLKPDENISIADIKNQIKGQFKGQIKEQMLQGPSFMNKLAEEGEHILGEREETDKSSTEILTAILPAIATIPNLESLDLSSNELDELPGLSPLSRLKRLLIPKNNLTIINSLPELKNLEHLDISYNNFDWSQDTLFNIKTLKTLKAFNTNNYSYKPANKFGQLTQLEALYLGDCCFTNPDFLEAIFQLPNLQHLEISRAVLGKIPDSFSKNSALTILILKECAIQELPLSIGHLNKLWLLDLARNPISQLPTSIGKLEQLAYLNLYDNELLELPQELCDLMTLKDLNISSNKLNSLPKRISRLTNLELLNASDNHLSKVPASLSFMTALQHLDISSCGLRRIPKEIMLMPAEVICHSNPLISPPSEIAARGKESIIGYFEDLERQKGEYLYEAKLLIVGSPGAGKTTLRLKLIDANCNLPSAEDSTDGIDVETLFFDLPKLSDNNRFRINIWDFGGQELYHSTHQFFLTRRSLYVLVLNTRRDDDRIDYWLHTLSIFGSGSPVIILQNQEKDRSYALNEQRYRAQYPNIKSFIAVNLSQASEIPKILHIIRDEIQELSHIGQEIPAQWMEVRQALVAKAKEVPYIDYEDFAEICSEFGIEERAKIEILSSYLHDLGAILHFADTRILKKVIFLRNVWVIDAAYRVLDNDLVKNKQQGRFSLDDLDQIWANPDYQKVKDELLELMLKFEVCFQIPETDQFMVPQLLAPNPPAFEFPDGAIASIRYQYDFMPRGLLTRFIVHMHHYIDDHSLVWKEGVILKRLNTFAKIVEDYDNRCIHITIAGARLKEALAIITDEFEQLHKTYPQKLEVQKLIPCNCSLCKKPENNPYLFEYRKLVGYLDNGRDKVVCDLSFKDVSIQPLLDGIQNPLLTNDSGEVKILFLAANPKDTQALDLDKEVEILRDMIESGRHQDRIRIDQRWEVSFDKLQQTILKFSPQIIHFSGHGIEEGLLLEDEKGFANIVGSDTLDSLFGPLQKEVVCVIMNACYSEHQAKSIGKHIPFVVGMNTAIADEAALLFTRGFYRGLANRLDVEFAFSMGLSLVQSKRPDQVPVFVLWKEGRRV